MQKLLRLSSLIYSLIEKTSTSLPSDVLKALRKAKENEAPDSIAYKQLSQMIENAKIAKKNKQAICQDTGTLYFFVESDSYSYMPAITRAIHQAVAKASENSLLRPNTICPLSGKSYKDNIHKPYPLTEFIHNPKFTKQIKISLLMKGGGSENVSCQYSLPDESLKAQRDLEGVKKVILHSVIEAQGKACPPGAIAVCIGGDRASAYSECKKILLNKISHKNSNPILADLEKDLLQRINSLQIGPQGLGGKTFALKVFISALPRHPASFFVTISHMCWAWRRNSITINLDS